MAVARRYHRPSLVRDRAALRWAHFCVGPAATALDRRIARTRPRKCGSVCVVLGARRIVEGGEAHREAGTDPLEGARGALGIRWREGDRWESTLALAADASARGLSPIGIIAYGALSPARVAEAAQARVTELALMLHGARREVHDWHAGSGSFDAVIGTMGAAKKHALRVGIATALTRSNARVLSELPPLLEASRVSMWALVALRADEVDSSFTATVPRIGLGVPAALSALARARRAGIDARIAGMPSCALGPYAACALASAPRSYGARCTSCGARSSCPGADAAYLARFGETELRALTQAIARTEAPPIASLLAAVEIDAADATRSTPVR